MPNDDYFSVAKGDAADVGNAAEEPDTLAENAELTIKNVAKMFGLPQLVLRYYELRGLIARRRRMGGTRTYGWADCGRIAFIIKCRRTSLPLGDIAPIVVAFDPQDDAVVCRRGQESCKALISRLDQRRKALDEMLAELAHTYSLLSVKAYGSHYNSNRD